VTTVEDTASAAVQIGASDVDGDALSYAVKAGAEPAKGSVSFDWDTGTFVYTPFFDTHGADHFTIVVSDGHGGTAEQQVAITVQPVNDAPVVAQAIAAQSIPEDTAWNFTVPAGTFVDVDGDALTFGARQSDGSALPAWLTFNAGSRTFTGTPPANYNGALALVVSATDPAGASASASFTLNVTAVNDAPVLVQAIGTQTIPEDALWTFGVPNSTFADADGDVLVYSARQSDGSVLPAWLTFNAGSRTFTGTPPANFHGALALVVSATDPAGASASASFTLNVTAVNDAPVLAQAIGTQTVLEDAAWSFTVPAGSFVDVDGDALTYTASQANGSALPSWISFNAATRTFTGTPPTNYSGSLMLVVTATDPGGASASASFGLNVTAVNDAPVLALPIGTQAIAEDTAWSFTVPAGTFTDQEGDALTYTARQANGSALPSWISFNAATRTFTGTPPANYNGSLALVVTATDSGGAAASAPFTLNVTAVNDAPVLAQAIAAQTAASGTTWTYVVPPATFTDVDGDTLVYTARQANGTALPSWISFNAATRTFTGTSPATFTGVLSLVVTATDPSGLNAAATFGLTVQGGTNPNPINGSPWGNSTLQGTPQSDTITAFGWNNKIYGNGGNDTITAGAGSATVTSGAGNDTIRLDGYNNTVNAGDGNNVISGSDGNSSITAGAGNDTITLGGYNNTVNAGNGNNTVSGSDGNSTITTGSGDDTVTLDGFNNTVSLGAGTNSVSGSDGNATVTAGDGANTITTDGFSNVITVGNGNNTINGGIGNGRVTVGNGNNTITMGGFNNSVTLGSGTNTVNLWLALNTVTMNGGTADISFYGLANRAILNAGTHATIHDIGYGTVFDVNAANVQLAIEMFEPTGIVRLTRGIGGYATTAAIKAALVSDGHGGSMLSLGSQGGYIDFVNIAPNQISAANFRLV
jgi:Ca2+-binding RTX toxin-like protein